MITICGFLFHTLHYFGEIIAGYLANDWKNCSLTISPLYTKERLWQQTTGDYDDYDCMDSQLVKSTNLSNFIARAWIQFDHMITI